MKMELYNVELEKDANGVLSFYDEAGYTVALFHLEGGEKDAKFVGSVMSPDAEVKFSMEIPYGAPEYEGDENLVNKIFADLTLSRGNFACSLTQLLWRTGVIKEKYLDLTSYYDPQALDNLR